MNVLEEIGLLLRPAGGGIHLVSSGRAEQVALQKKLYRAGSEEEIAVRFEETLGRISAAHRDVRGGGRWHVVPR